MSNWLGVFVGGILTGWLLVIVFASLMLSDWPWAIGALFGCAICTFITRWGGDKDAQND
jgi:NhaP-type Na+/H+ or K+/H+ antiporter